MCLSLVALDENTVRAGRRVSATFSHCRRGSCRVPPRISVTDPDFSSTGLVLSPLYPFYRNLFFFCHEKCFQKLAVGGSWTDTWNGWGKFQIPLKVALKGLSSPLMTFLFGKNADYIFLSTIVEPASLWHASLFPSLFLWFQASAVCQLIISDSWKLILRIK